MAYPRSQRSRGFKFFIRNAGSLTLNSTTWVDLPTIGTTWDASLSAQVGDVIETGVSVFYSNEGVQVALDVVSIVSASPVNAWGNQTTPDNASLGVPSWFGETTVNQHSGGSVMKTLVSGDISGGAVTLRLRYRTIIASAKTLTASAACPFHWWVKNLGPVSPH